MPYADLVELHRRQPRRLEGVSAAPPAGAPMIGAPMTGAASFLAYLGGAPLMVAALAMIADPLRLGGAAQEFIVLYGAALLVFFGGVRWGVAVMKPGGPSMRSLLGAVLPMLAALPLFGPGATALKIVAIMVLMFALMLDDLGATRRGDGAPAWYLGVRAPLTVFIEVALLVALVAAWRG